MTRKILKTEDLAVKLPPKIFMEHYGVSYGKSQSDMLKQNCKKQCYPVLICQGFQVSNRKFHIFTLANRPFALRGHVSFAAMLEGKQIGCYALLWKKWLPLMSGKGKYIKFPRHFLLCFKTMGYLQTCMMCTSLRFY